MRAPSASVLPPAPAQKSTTISPRLGATRLQSNWLPSSCTSMQPSRNSACRLIAGFPAMRIPWGEYGVAAPRAVRRRDALEKAPAPERRIHRIGDRGAVVPADLGVAAEKRGERRIGGLSERQHGRKGR